MAIRFVCPCGMKLKAAEDKVGKKVLCPACGHAATVPESDTQSSAENFTSSSQIADSLLRDTDADSGKAPAHPHTATPQSDIDVAATVIYLATNFGPRLVAVIVVAWVVYWSASLVFESVTPKPELAPVTGQVTLDRKPLVGATVMFQPEKEEGSDRRAAASLGRTDREGRFELTYVRNVKGAAVGRHRVEIRAAGPDGRERVPARFNAETELFRVVRAGEENEFYFHLQTQR